MRLCNKTKTDKDSAANFSYPLGGRWFVFMKQIEPNSNYIDRLFQLFEVLVNI